MVLYNLENVHINGGGVKMMERGIFEDVERGIHLEIYEIPTFLNIKSKIKCDMK